MLKSMDLSAAAYRQLYRNTTLELKVSGEIIASSEFEAIAKTIEKLRLDCRLCIVPGGGEQISIEHERLFPEKRRQKIDGIGVTTEYVLESVLRAQKNVRERLTELIPDIAFIEPADMPCEYLNRDVFGYVGKPVDIRISDHDVVATGFVGMVDGQLVNVNADDVATAVLNKEKVNEVILLTGIGGIKNNKNEIVPLLTDERLKKIIDAEDEEIRVTGGMKQKIRSVLTMLQSGRTKKVAITLDLEKEIFSWAGSGTLCIREDALVLGPMLSREDRIFDEMYLQNVNAGTFRARPDAELRAVKENHLMMRVDNSPVGGVSLLHHDDCIELATLWSGFEGNGMGKRIIQGALKQEQIKRHKVYALTVGSGRSFVSAGFMRLGTVEEVQLTNAPDFIKQYAAEQRKTDVSVYMLDPSLVKRDENDATDDEGHGRE